MGDIANSMINGEMCQYCGEYLGEETGYPRSCSGCSSSVKKARNSIRKLNGPTKGKAAIKGVMNFLKGKNVEPEDVIGKYGQINGLEVISGDYIICEFIQKDFGKFVKWFKENYR